ncbi:MAG: hypothetical protein HXS48_02480 [Theionarchaea archaeon]|nr:hypothetical protein [Theionarchaea archaeon]
MRRRVLVGTLLACLILGIRPTADAWGEWFEDNNPGELTASYLTGPLTYEELKEYYPGSSPVIVTLEKPEDIEPHSQVTVKARIENLSKAADGNYIIFIEEDIEKLYISAKYFEMKEIDPKMLRRITEGEIDIRDLGVSLKDVEINNIRIYPEYNGHVLYEQARGLRIAKSSIDLVYETVQYGVPLQFLLGQFDIDQISIILKAADWVQDQGIEKVMKDQLTFLCRENNIKEGIPIPPRSTLIIEIDLTVPPMERELGIGLIDMQVYIPYRYVNIRGPADMNVYAKSFLERVAGCHDIIICNEGCFIATAAYGSPLHRDIDVLRSFRDVYLKSNLIGDIFVNIYYSTSPPIANVLSQHDKLRTSVRLFLVYPLVYASKIFFSIILAMIAGVCLIPILFLVRREKLVKCVFRSVMFGIMTGLLLLLLVFFLGWLSSSLQICAVLAAYTLPFIVPIILSVIIMSLVPQVRRKYLSS